MKWLECILIIAGISFDMLASMEVQGAMLQEIKKKKLLGVTSLVVLLQCIFFIGGYLGSYLLSKVTPLKDANQVGYFISAVIFLLLGLRLLVKAIRREFVDECRKEITVKQYVRIIAVFSIYTIFAGIGCQMLGANLLYMVIIIIAFSFLDVFAGIYGGYHFGFEAKTKWYAVGTIILWFTGVEIIVRNLMTIM